MAITTAYSASVTITRPANTTAYTANDVLGGAIKFNTIGPPGGRIMVTSASIEGDVGAIPAGMTSIMKLACYSVTPPSEIADNGVFDLPAGDRASFLGFITIGSLADLGSTLYVEADQINKQLQLAAGCSDLYAYLVTAGGFTPAGNSEVYKVTLHSVAL